MRPKTALRKHRIAEKCLALTSRRRRGEDVAFATPCDPAFIFRFLMRWRILVVLTALGAGACSTLIGLGDFHDAPAGKDASAPGGAAGSDASSTGGATDASASDGSGGTGGTGGSMEAGSGGSMEAGAGGSDAMADAMPDAAMDASADAGSMDAAADALTMPDAAMDAPADAGDSG